MAAGKSEHKSQSVGIVDGKSCSAVAHRSVNSVWTQQKWENFIYGGEPCHTICYLFVKIFKTAEREWKTNLIEWIDIRFKSMNRNHICWKMCGKSNECCKENGKYCWKRYFSSSFWMRMLRQSHANVCTCMPRTQTVIFVTNKMRNW